MKPVRTATLGGKPCRIDQVYEFGEAWSPRMRGQSNKPYLRVDDRLTGLCALDTLIHESSHIQHPNWSEKRVAREATELARLLYRMGYRRIEEK